jgi:hypothetical protein
MCRYFYILSIYLFTTVFCIFPMDVLEAMKNTLFSIKAKDTIFVKTVSIDRATRAEKLFIDCPIKKSNVALIGALSIQYEKYKHEQNFVPELCITKERLELLDNALSIDSDKFKSYFSSLSAADKQVLIRLSGKYCLDVPEMVQRTVECALPQGVCELISFYKFTDPEVEARISNHCLRRCIQSKNWLGRIEQSSQGYEYCNLDLHSSFFAYASGYDIPLAAKPLSLKGKPCATFGTIFLSDELELRITNEENSDKYNAAPSLGSICYLHVVNNKTQESIVCKEIVHADHVKGYCSTKVNDNSLLLATYSKRNVIVSHVEKDESGAIVVETINACDVPLGEEIKTACFAENTHTLCIVQYKDQCSIVGSVSESGIFNKVASFSCAKWGLIRSMFFAETFECDDEYESSKAVVLSFTPDKRVAILSSDDQGNITYNRQVNDRLVSHLVTINKSLLSLHEHCSYFKSVREYDKISDQQGFFENMLSSRSFVLGDENHRTYSPDGRFMMINSLKKIFGELHINTKMVDAVTHQDIVSTDTRYSTFTTIFHGVGFSKDSQSLLFFGEKNIGMTCLKKIVLGNDIYDIYGKCWIPFKKYAFQDLATKKLLWQLIFQIEKKGYLSLSKDSEIRKALITLSKQSSDMLNFLKICFPMAPAK